MRKLSPTPPDGTLFCWDCEVILHDRGPLCYTCARHRENGHEPQKIPRRREWCHGSGPEGRQYERLGMYPRAVSWLDTAAYARDQKKRAYNDSVPSEPTE